MTAVLETYDEGVYTITLNRPEKKNAMDYELLKDLYDALKRAESQKAPFVIIRGSGKAFCSGGDIVAFKSDPDAAALIDAEAGVLHESIKTIRTMNAIVIAAIEGVAVGAGVGLALACDLSIATKNTIMNMGYRRIGLTPDGGASIFLARMVGAKRFNAFYLFSQNITMDEARALGLVNIVCEEEDFEEKLNRIIASLRVLPMETIGYFKDLVNRSLYSGFESHLDKERFYVSELAGKPLFKERIEEFLKNK
jgi:2-(1,2-epoxy-1,2-dihydrophenyl)acetyl-CoA isomerase